MCFNLFSSGFIGEDFKEIPGENNLFTTGENLRMVLLNKKEFFNKVKEIKKVNFYEGHFSGTSGKEKGVDVRLAVDLVLGACTNKYDEAIIMTGDADLTYAVSQAKIFKKIHLMDF